MPVSEPAAPPVLAESLEAAVAEPVHVPVAEPAAPPVLAESLEAAVAEPVQVPVVEPAQPIDQPAPSQPGPSQPPPPPSQPIIVPAPRPVPPTPSPAPAVSPPPLPIPDPVIEAPFIAPRPSPAPSIAFVAPQPMPQQYVSSGQPYLAPLRLPTPAQPSASTTTGCARAATASSLLARAPLLSPLRQRPAVLGAGSQASSRAVTPNAGPGRAVEQDLVAEVEPHQRAEDVATIPKPDKPPISSGASRLNKLVSKPMAMPAAIAGHSASRSVGGAVGTSR